MQEASKVPFLQVPSIPVLRQQGDEPEICRRDKHHSPGIRAVPHLERFAPHRVLLEKDWVGAAARRHAWAWALVLP